MSELNKKASKFVHDLGRQENQWLMCQHVPFSERALRDIVLQVRYKFDLIPSQDYWSIFCHWV